MQSNKNQEPVEKSWEGWTKIDRLLTISQRTSFPASIIDLTLNRITYRNSNPLKTILLDKRASHVNVIVDHVLE